ncbi:MAG: aryl-sulfate sulfotransferase [Cellulophaga sp.]
MYKIFQFILIVILLGSCSKDNNNSTEIPELIQYIKQGTTGTAEFFDAAKVNDDYILVNDPGNSAVYIMNKDAKVLHEWQLSSGLGNDVFLLPNGKLIASLDASEQHINLGGSAGVIEIIGKDGQTEWHFDYSTNDYITHHDVELLPNGNVLAIVWERKTIQEANFAGSSMDIDIFPEVLIEIDPKTNEIVWEWHSWDHLIQNFDTEKENFGLINAHPELINLNYVPHERGDIMHANGLSFDPEKNVIYLSVNFFSEVWVIDHSTTTEQASTHNGGNYNKGGDLIYRFGNPEAYKSSAGARLFNHNHFPNLLDNEGKGNMLIYSNGAQLEQSTVYELKMPNTFSLDASLNNEPQIIWEFTHKDLFAPKVSGAVRLSNGNTLITEGDFGIWEVTPKGQVVWLFEGKGFFWRAYNYEKDSPAIKALGL